MAILDYLMWSIKWYEIIKTITTFKKSTHSISILSVNVPADDARLESDDQI